MDAIEECAISNNPNVLLVSLECIVGFLEALEELCEGKYVPPNTTEINNKWPKLEDADYKGPLTYQSLARLPSPYRFVKNHIFLLKEFCIHGKFLQRLSSRNAKQN